MSPEWKNFVIGLLNKFNNFLIHPFRKPALKNKKSKQTNRKTKQIEMSLSNAIALRNCYTNYHHKP